MTTTWDTDELDRSVAALTAGEQRPASPGSALAAARRKRDSAIQKKYLDLIIPNMEGADGEAYFVRYRAIEYAQSNRINKRHEKSKDDNKDLIVNSLVLAECCVGVGRQMPDGTKLSVDPDDGKAADGWPRFDQRLADLLEIDSTGVMDVIKALYDKDGYILAAGARLTEWSGFVMTDVEEAVSGG